MNIFEEIKIKAEEIFKKAKGSHDWEHTLRVLKLAIKIAEKEKADLEVIKIATILHDIARKEQDDSRGKFCHAVRGSEMAKEILADYNLDKNKKENIIHSIKSHRFRGDNFPETLEAKILFDADKLDSIGAIGIGKAFLFSGEIGAKLHNKNVDIKKTQDYSIEDTAYREFLVKLQHVKDKLFTDEGKKIAEARHNFMKEFFNRLNDEFEGIK